MEWTTYCNIIIKKKEINKNEVNKNNNMNKPCLAKRKSKAKIDM